MQPLASCPKAGDLHFRAISKRLRELFREALSADVVFAAVTKHKLP